LATRAFLPRDLAALYISSAPPACGRPNSGNKKPRPVSRAGPRVKDGGRLFGRRDLADHQHLLGVAEDDQLLAHFGVISSEPLGLAETAIFSRLAGGAARVGRYGPTSTSTPFSASGSGL
jgi:hypothetical protein